jgi:hypothetical protein
MDQATYNVRSAGDHVWHIPGDTGTPLCGEPLRSPQKLFLPATLAADDVLCAKCLALYEAAPGSPGSEHG